MRLRSAAAFAAVLLLAFGAGAALPAVGRVAARPAAAATPAQEAFDFLVENVCLDGSGKVLIGVSPIDGDPRCVTQRKLRPGEPLVYHLRESPAAGSWEGAGRWRATDSFPVETRALGMLAIHLYDLEAGRLGEFGRYDPAERAGGGGIAAVSSSTASYIATQLGRQNLKLFIGGGCRPGQPVSTAALRDSWVLVPLARMPLRLPLEAPEGPDVIAGGIVSTPANIVDADDGARCPIRMVYGTSRWSVQPVTYRAVYKFGPHAGQHVRLWSLVVERTGRIPGALGRAVAFERAYFTRELGWTRWEGWKNPNALFSGSPQWASEMPGVPNRRVLVANERVMRRGNCALPTGAAPDSGYAIPVPPADSRGVPRSDLLIVGCLELTDPVPPRDPAGDPAPIGPGTWFYAISHDPNSSVSSLLAP